MTISLDLIKKVREATGAGVNDVKKALDESAGDEQKAVEILRKQGQKIAANKAQRLTREGIIALKQGKNKIAVVELACETDFVARNEDFINAADELAQQLLALGKEEFASWADEQIKNQLIVKIGENIQLGKFEIISGEVIGSYLHLNRKVAAVAVLSGGDEALAKEVAMQVTAMNPRYLKPAVVPVTEIEKEKEIYRDQLKGEARPENIMAKILEGKLQKFYTEVCLLKQPYIKDDKMTVEKLLGPAEVKEFYRFSL